MSGPQFLLEIVDGPQRGREIALREGDLVVGRSPRCTVVLSDAQVAPTHCGLRVRSDQVILAPGGSAVTTVVNGARIDRARLLRVGDTIEVGSYKLVLRVQSSGEEQRFYPGDQVGPFRLLSELGAGAVGRVFEATDDRGRTVALKMLRRRRGWSHREEEHRRALFRREAEVLQSIAHPNVVRVYGSGEHQEVPWLAMELLDGPTLREKMVGGRMAIRQIESIMFQLGAALAAVHAAGIVHRDLKPANVILVGPEERVCLADFGLAQPVSAEYIEDLDPGVEAGAIRVGRQIGTPAYMAPEQTFGADCDQRSDVWALGAVLYELAAGRRPFPGNDVRAVLNAVVHDCPQALPDDLAPSLRGAVYRALQKKPARRFESAVRLTEALHERRVVQWLPVGGDGPPAQPLEGCPLCRAPIVHPIRCEKCHKLIFRYTDGQVLTVPDGEGGLGLACGACGGAVQADSRQCQVCRIEFHDLPPEGLSKSAPLLAHSRAVVVDIYDQAQALLTACPLCAAPSDGQHGSCQACGFSVKAYVRQRLKLELAVGGWSIVCGHCHTPIDGPETTHCPHCGLSFISGQYPDGTRHEDQVLPGLRKKLEEAGRG
jgi:tRNA A-37 threonylcarbamoyl transferase component Bud32